uniref:Uncharacterized protein n=1 Tax=Moniliophthora roreri TaxID=221103 RepID=A0A0W0GCG7_MONRR
MTQRIRNKENLDPRIHRSSTLDISSKLPEEPDPFQKLLEALKNSSKPRTPRLLMEMLEDKKPQGSKPKVELEPEEMKIRSAVSVQVVSEDKEVKAALLVLFTGE